jgi:hypothetical protein
MSPTVSVVVEKGGCILPVVPKSAIAQPSSPYEHDTVFLHAVIDALRAEVLRLEKLTAKESKSTKERKSKKK